MNDYELAITRCKQLEALLEQGLQAQGKGLHEKITSIQGKLPEPLVRKMRFIATVRNKLVHDAAYERLDNREGYLRACDEAEKELRALLTPVVINKGGCFGSILVVAGVLLALMLWATRHL